MDTERARELLPWLLNGSLEEPERGELLTALRTDEQLRRELAETRLAGEVFGQHVAAADLVAHAFGEPAGLGRERIEAHVALCERCAEELAMARESRELAGEPETGAAAPDAAPPREERRRRRLLPFLRPAPALAGGGVATWWQPAALAASVAALVAVGGWIWSWQQAQGRIADLVASTRESLPPQAGPDAGRAGLVADVLRSTGDVCGGPNCLALETRVGVATLHVQAETEPGEVYELRLLARTGDGREIRIQPVATVPDGQLMFRPPVSLLEAGEYDAALYRLGDRGWERVESYALTVVFGRR